jgi:hypothetical protein
VDRKLVKQTVMTSVYGITRVGAREQFSNRLRERGWRNEQEVFRCSWYLTHLTLDALGELFKNAKVGASQGGGGGGGGVAMPGGGADRGLISGWPASNRGPG